MCSTSRVPPFEPIPAQSKTRGIRWLSGLMGTGSCCTTTKGWVASLILVDFVLRSFRACALEILRMVTIVCAGERGGQWRGVRPGDRCYESPRVNEKLNSQNMCFVGHVASPLSHLVTWLNSSVTNHTFCWSYSITTELFRHVTNTKQLSSSAIWPSNTLHTFFATWQ